MRKAHGRPSGVCACRSVLVPPLEGEPRGETGVVMLSWAALHYGQTCQSRLPQNLGDLGRPGLSAPPPQGP